MTRYTTQNVTAILGPTNTGKTHLAVERLCAHSSGIMGFPLRLLAREIYDRVVTIKGRDQVGLITGEERILPDKARWLLSTVESMPMDRDVAFVAVDEAQLGANPERGHVFTDRLLRARGREETMLLGSDSLRPMIRSLIPDAEIIGRPRFSTLSYAGAKKLSRLPPRSAIVAFSAEEVYAVAEMLRRLRGGAAVVMGALSPHTRNAQVAMFQSGEVDYLVATDAIGMGLNMDVAHVAFAGLAKFDGRRRRRLTLAEMAQIAGRAGRHQRDGSFGTLGKEEVGIQFTPEEIDRIENHRFEPLNHMFWRDGVPDYSSIDALLVGLEAHPQPGVLRAAPESIDLAVLKRMTAEHWVRDRVRHPHMVARLWAACGLPDFRKHGAEHHARLVSRIFEYLSENQGHIPSSWFADQIARLDTIQGDVETLAGRIAAIRTWAYIAHRKDWLADPIHWAERTRAIEQKLSDALHTGLTQRFVDRRTTILMREIGADPDTVKVVIEDTGAVLIDDEAIGQLNGFDFIVDPLVRHADRKKLLAIAGRRLGKELALRGARLCSAPDQDFSLFAQKDAPIAIAYNGHIIAHFAAGKSLLLPNILLERIILTLEKTLRDSILKRVALWVDQSLKHSVAPLQKIAMTASAANTPASLRAILAPLAQAGGVMPRHALDPMLAILDKPERYTLRKLGIVIGALDIFHPQLIRPNAMLWRTALLSIRDNHNFPDIAPPGAALMKAPYNSPDFRNLGTQALRVDLVERLARAAHDARDGRKAFTPDPSLATSLGLSNDSLTRLMRLLGFEADKAAEKSAWRWRGRVRAKKQSPIISSNAFAELGQLLSLPE